MMRICFKLALLFFALAVLLAIISIMLRAGLQQTSYLSLFNALAISITGCMLVSFSLSITGIIREKIGRYRYYLLIAGNLLFLVWVLLD
jgi:hypothetical protein